MSSLNRIKYTDSVTNMEVRQKLHSTETIIPSKGVKKQ